MLLSAIRVFESAVDPTGRPRQWRGRMRHPKDMSRRQFLTRAGGAAIAMPSLAAILAACSKPSEAGGGGGGSSSTQIPIATPQNPVELPLKQDPISSNTP